MNYEEMIDEMLMWARKNLSPERVPHEIRFGRYAYERVRSVLADVESPGLPNDRYGIPRTLLHMTGLPLRVDPTYPPNLWVILDGRGLAVQTGTLHRPEDDGSGNGGIDEKPG